VAERQWPSRTPDCPGILRDGGVALVLITKQSGIARGYFDVATLERIHDRLRSMLATEGLQGGRQDREAGSVCGSGQRDRLPTRRAGCAGRLRPAAPFRVGWRLGRGSAESGLLIQIGAILATGNDALVGARSPKRPLSGLPAELAHRIAPVVDPLAAPALAFAPLEGEGAALADARLASRPGPIVRLQALSSARLAAGEDYKPRRGMRDRHKHRGGRRQRDHDDDRVGRSAVAGRAPPAWLRDE
jgi:hypothetical protein